MRTGHVGDLFCKVSAETPVKLTKKQKELLQEFQSTLNEGGSRHSPRSSSWTSKLKSFFDDLVT